MGDHAEPSADLLEIRSYRTVFDLERRLYRIDRLRLNPGGVPLRGVAYFVALVLAGTVASRLPLVAVLVDVLPWYLRDVALPGLAAALLTMVRVEGRPFHLAVRARLRHLTGPCHLRALRGAPAPGRCWTPPDVLLLPDGSEPRLRRIRFVGPGAVMVSGAHERIESRPTVLRRLGRRADVTLRCAHAGRAPARGQVIDLLDGARLDVRPAARRR